ncbi:MAG: hypothetical protein CTY23_11980 [Methylomonas sp.]|nr:MAG: hypothetical protein CTY23_11980 [Methylomonas sp.]
MTQSSPLPSLLPRETAHLCSMKITQDVRNYAQEKGLQAEDALQQGMAEKSKQFLEEGAAIYHEV